MAKPPTFARGEELTASKLNELVRYIERATRLQGGPGVRVVSGPGGSTISVDSAGVRGRYPARITVAPPAGVPIDAALALYDARADAPYTGVTFSGAPTMGRPVSPLDPGVTPFIIPARVGDYCEIIVRDDPSSPGDPLVELRIETEAPHWNTCATDGGLP